jgi:hypothetical protein
MVTVTDCRPWFHRHAALHPPPCAAIKGAHQTLVSPFSPLSPPRHRALAVHSALLSPQLPYPPSVASSPTGVPRTVPPLKPCAPPTGAATLIAARVGPRPRETLRRATTHFRRDGVTGTSVLRPSTRSVDVAPTTSCVPTTFSSRRPPPPDVAPHCRSPPAEPRPRGHRPLVSLLFHQWPNRVPHLTGHLAHPRPHLTAPPLTRIDAAVEHLGSPASPSGQKFTWAGPGRPWPNGLGPFQQYRFAFFFRN